MSKTKSVRKRLLEEEIATEVAPGVLVIDPLKVIELLDRLDRFWDGLAAIADFVEPNDAAPYANEVIWGNSRKKVSLK